MKNKGFTLIELLAVIVILAVVALIVTPVVSGIITHARNSANARSVEGHIRNVELAIITNAFNSGAGDLAVYDRVDGLLPNGLILPENDKITCETYTINNGQVIEAHGCSDYNSANWHYAYKYTAINGAEIEGDKEDFTPRNELAIFDGYTWDGYITMTLFYPDNSTNRKWRIGEAGYVREEEWMDYNGSITIPISEVENVYIKYKIADKVTIIPPQGTTYVDIEPTNYEIKENQKINVSIYSDGDEVYYNIGTGWLEYIEPFEVDKSTMIYAKAIKYEDVYNSQGNKVSTRKVTEYDSVYIRPYGQKKGTVPSIGSSQGQTSTGEIIYASGTYDSPTNIVIPYVPASPTIEVTPSSLTNEVSVSITTPVQARKIYYKIGNGSYKEYVGSFKVSENTTIYSYYIDDEEGSKSNVGSKYINNIVQKSVEGCDLPYLAFNTTPSLRKKYIDNIEVEILSNTEDVYYSYNGVEYQNYSEKLNITENKTVYAKAVNSCGETINYINITNIGKNVVTEPPKVKDSLDVLIYLNPENSNGEYVDTVKVTIEYDKKANKKYYKIGSGTLEEYTGPFDVTQNDTIYAYAISDNGYGETYKNINNIGYDAETPKGISSPVISANPSNRETTEVEITIDYASNATIKQYKIGTGNLTNYTGPFKVSENVTIYAINKDSEGNSKTSSYTINNIKEEPPIYLINNGDYFILKLNYPTSSDKAHREYRFADNDWKTYKDDGILLVLPNANINTDGKILVKDENGNEKEFNGDYYVLTCPPSEIFSNIKMRWDTGKPKTPTVILSTEDATRKLDVSIDYDETSILKEYKIVYNDGTSTEWQKYKQPFEIDKNKTTIYTRAQNESEVYSEIGIYTINNIDEIAPTINLLADFTTATRKLKIKVNVIDDVGVELVKYEKGLKGVSYFKENGNLINNNSTVIIEENDTYTFYAIDLVGNVETYTVEVTNIDNTAPDIEIIEEPSEGMGLESTITIDYGDSTERKYKIGNGSWQNYTKPFTITSNTILAQNLKNDDYSYTVCAQGKDSSGNVAEVCRNIYNLDLDVPSTPIITSNAGYPVLSIYGIELNNHTIIKYDKRKDIDNYYSLDGETWSKYTGEFNIEKGTVYAKSVKKNSGLTVQSTAAVGMPKDALPTSVYDGSNSSGAETRYSTYYLSVDESMRGKKIRMYSRFSKITEILSDGKETVIINNNGWENTSTATLSNDAIKLKVTGGGSYSMVYEIAPMSDPIINSKEVYPILYDYGIVANGVDLTITYFSSSQQRLYRINDGEWQNYNNQLIHLSINDIIEAQGIDKNGKETIISSYKAVLANGSLPSSVYDDSNSSGVETRYSTYYLGVDESMRGKKIRMYSRFSKITEILSDGTEKVIINNNDWGKALTGTLSNNTVKLKVTGGGSYSMVYEIGPA